ncbi:spore coat-associated protein S [Anoxybacillus tepidamans]|uniref:Spore coat-associated protein S n=1 Tax=Anoxybacteroides tepidamans TaxID=265948 RepID=A0A7W8IRU0_9BACL|nr:CotS family spore coat protein [Anoxybacillus tepidamans]MBB5325533.1 spore coat-associated protein S [Anoxybacillus tepidamans]
MKTVAEEWIDYVLQLYPYEVEETILLSVKKDEKIWNVKTDQGDKTLKQMAVRPERMLFYKEAHLHLQKQRFPIAKLCPTKNGGLCVGGGGFVYELYDEVSGSDVSYYNIDQLVRAMRFLGRFHQASQGFTPSKAGKKRNRLGKWHKSYLWNLQQLQGYKKVATHFTDDPFSLLFLEKVDQMLEMGNEALRLLETSAYAEWTSGSEKWNGFIHKDISLSSFAEVDGEIWIKTPPPIAIDLPPRDIRNLLNKVMKKMAVWDDHLAVQLLRSYDSTYPLTKQQYLILQADLLFPHLFTSVIQKYYLEQKKTWSDEKYMWELQTSIVVEETKVKMLENLIKEVT